MSNTPSTSSAASTSTSSKKKNSKRKRKNDDSSDDDSDDANDYAPSSSRKALPQRALVIFCVNCKGRFIRKIGDDDTVNLCSNCQSGSSKTAAPKKKKKILPSVKKHVYSDNILPSLQDICISVVADYIDDVESFGFISDESFEKLAKIISRNRKLNDQTSKLFMEPFRRKLRLFDCTNMTENGFFMISQFCIRLQALGLSYCGRITDKVLSAYSERLHDLKSLELSGAFLITKEAWKSFFESVGSRLEEFGLRHSARFDKSCIEALTQHCPNLRKLELGHLNKLNSDWLFDIAKLEKLESLELAWTVDGNTLETDDMIHLLSKVGPKLKSLSIRGGTDLNDEILTEGILKHCTRLKKLNLEQCEKLTAKAMVQFLNDWRCEGLDHLDLSRCILFDDEVLKAVVQHSGNSLKHLSLHSLELLSPTGLELLAGNGDDLPSCQNLTHLNCGFVRSMDDFVLKKLITSCTALRNIQVWGCYMVCIHILLKCCWRF